jgi:hypothetical protein
MTQNQTPDPYVVERCQGKSRQTGEPCGLPPVPFGRFCR